MMRDAGKVDILIYFVKTFDLSPSLLACSRLALSLAISLSELGDESSRNLVMTSTTSSQLLLLYSAQQSCISPSPIALEDIKRQKQSS